MKPDKKIQIGSENVNNTEVTCISLCSGYEGIGLGLKRVIPNLRTILYSEIEKYACEVLVKRMEEGKIDIAPIWTNLKTMPCEQFSGKVDILTGGYPCQGFSAAGKRLGEKDHRYLWGYFREIIRIIKPKLCFFENVEGHVSLGLREVLTDLANLGYRVANDCGEPTFGLFSASEVGAPHQRKRVFILAYSSNPRPRNNPGQVGGETRSEVLRQEDREERSVRADSAGSSEELGNTRSTEPNRIPEPEEWQQDREIGDTGVELADTHSTGRTRRGNTCGMGREWEPNKAMANTSYEGFQECGNEREFPSPGAEPCSTITGSCYQWPARPGEPQYEWEEPRVVGESSAKRCEQDPILRSEQQSGWIDKIGGKRTAGGEQGQIKSPMGRTINGSGSRVDRLRLLGNGVVPATAEKAFRVLYDRIINPNEQKAPQIQKELF